MVGWDVVQRLWRRERQIVGRWLVWLGTAVLLLTSAACQNAEDPAPSQEPTSQPQALTGTHFTNVAADVGLNFQHGAFRWGLSGDPEAMMGSGLCWLDYDNDGWLDLYVMNSYAEAEAGQWEASGGLPQSALFKNEQGQFRDVTQSSQAGMPMRGTGCVATDLNLDGWTDIYITTARYNFLLWNRGDGTFQEGAQAAGVDGYGWQTAVSVGDLNEDGWPDLFVAGYVDTNNRIPEATKGFPNTHIGRRDLLYLNQGIGANGLATFLEVGEVAGLEKENFEYGLGSLLSDFDADGDLDLYVANDTNPNRLYVNVPWVGGKAADPQGLGFRFVESGAIAQATDMNSGMGVAGGDYDGDGRSDIFITNLGDQLHSIYQNQSSPAAVLFDNSADRIGIEGIGVGKTGWGTAWADIDLDTDLDLLVANGKVPVVDMAADGEVAQLFENLTAQGQVGQFRDASTAFGLATLGPMIGRGAAAADYDNDGDLDFAINSTGQPLVLLRNDGAVGNWLEIAFVGGQAGATVTAVLPDGRRLMRELHVGSSYLSSEDPRLHLGLGSATEVAELIIRLPNGTERRLSNVPANQYILVSP